MTGQGVLIEPNADEALVSEHIRRKLNKAPDPKPSTTVVAWVALERRRRDLETMLATVVTEQDKARQRLLEEWSLTGINSEKVDGLTIHLRRKLYPKVRDKARLAVALQERGLTELLTVDEKAFAVYVTAMDEEGQPLPDSIAAHTGESFERFDLAVRLKSTGDH